MSVTRFSGNNNSMELTRSVSKAFLIKGGTEKDRQEKYKELYQGDQLLMYGDYAGENELAVIFSTKHSDFENMTFEEAKSIAGNVDLGADFCTSTFGNEQRFGVIDVSVQPKLIKTQANVNIEGLDKAEVLAGLYNNAKVVGMGFGEVLMSDTRFSENNNSMKSTRSVSKAFLIKGGTEKDRQEKYKELYQGDQFLMPGDYAGENELAVIFSTKHSDFENMTFEEAKSIAGNVDLGADFCTSRFGNKQRFGVIDVSVQPKLIKTQANVNIEGLDKAEVLAGLYNNAKVGMGFFEPSGLGSKAGTAMTTEEARAEIDELKEHSGSLYFDYLHGKKMKVDLTNNEFDPSAYDAFSGKGASQKIVEDICTKMKDEINEKLSKLFNSRCKVIHLYGSCYVTDLPCQPFDSFKKNADLLRDAGVGVKLKPASSLLDGLIKIAPKLEFSSTLPAILTAVNKAMDIASANQKAMTHTQ